MKRFAFVSIVLSVLVGNAAIAEASFVPRPNRPPIGTGGAGTRFRELPPRRIDPIRDPKLVELFAQNDISDLCDDGGAEYYFRCEYNKNGEVIKVVKVDRKTGKETPVWSKSLIKADSEKPVTDPKQCGDRVAVVDENGQIVCVDVEAVKPAPGCIVMGSPSRPIVTCKPFIATTEHSKSVPSQNPADTYPGLPPAPADESDRQVETA